MRIVRLPRRGSVAIVDKRDGQYKCVCRYPLASTSLHIHLYGHYKWKLYRTTAISLCSICWNSLFLQIVRFCTLGRVSWVVLRCLTDRKLVWIISFFFRRDSHKLCNWITENCLASYSIKCVMLIELLVYCLFYVSLVFYIFYPYCLF